MSSVLLASVGVITDGITLNPIVLGTLITAGILLKTYHELRNMGYNRFTKIQQHIVWKSLNQSQRSNEGWWMGLQKIHI